MKGLAMRLIALFVKFTLVFAFATLGVVLAQEGMPQPVAGNQQQAGRGGQPAAAGPSALPGATQPPAADEATYRQQVGYFIGREFGQSLRENGVVVDQQGLVAGISDGLKDAKPKWSEQELMAVMQRFNQEMQQKAAVRAQQAQQIAAVNRQQEAAFLAENKTKEGVQATASGLQYKVLKQGNGPSPTRTDTVRCNYRGTLLNGEEFDSSERHGGPVEFPVSRVIPGWTEALQKMRVGDKWQLFVPAALAYEDQEQGKITPGSMLIFEIELLSIVNQPLGPANR
jgi:FKBP-type peptidyl-prolyl cis-trans isomerase FklB